MSIFSQMAARLGQRPLAQDTGTDPDINTINAGGVDPTPELQDAVPASEVMQAFGQINRGSSFSEFVARNRSALEEAGIVAPGDRLYTTNGVPGAVDKAGAYYKGLGLITDIDKVPAGLRLPLPAQVTQITEADVANEVPTERATSTATTGKPGIVIEEQPGVGPSLTSTAVFGAQPEATVTYTPAKWDRVCREVIDAFRRLQIERGHLQPENTHTFRGKVLEVFDKILEINPQAKAGVGLTLEQESNLSADQLLSKLGEVIDNTFSGSRAPQADYTTEKLEELLRDLDRTTSTNPYRAAERMRELVGNDKLTPNAKGIDEYDIEVKDPERALSILRKELIRILDYELHLPPEKRRVTLPQSDTTKN